MESVIVHMVLGFKSTT